MFGSLAAVSLILWGYGFEFFGGLTGVTAVFVVGMFYTGFVEPVEETERREKQDDEKLDLSFTDALRETLTQQLSVAPEGLTLVGSVLFGLILLTASFEVRYGSKWAAELAFRGCGVLFFAAPFVAMYREHASRGSEGVETDTSSS